jgi:rod shape determining protein RodA
MPPDEPLMVEYVGTPRTLRSTREEATRLGALVRQLDWVLLGAVGALVVYGLWVIAGVTKHDVPDNEDYYLVRQGIFAGVGVVGLACATLVNPTLYRRWWQVLYWLTIGLMVVVFVAAPLTRGSKRWLDVGFFRFQPSEFGKVLFVLALAAFLADRTKRLSDPRTTATCVGLALMPILLVFLQPDIGTALVYGAALAAVLFVAGTRWLHLAALGAALVVALALVLSILPAAGVHVLKPYQQERLTGFTNPDSDPGGATYNANQSITAVGAGGLRGRGVEGATQTSLDYLPEHGTDFVFASLAEQRGFVGASLLLCLYLLLVWRGLRIVALARDPYSAIVAGGIVIALLFQIFVNVGMTMGIAPITGIPLPFVSVGGSSMISNLVAVGVLLAIHARGRDERPSSLFSARS